MQFAVVLFRKKCFFLIIIKNSFYLKIYTADHDQPTKIYIQVVN